ncbi:hypothetical protein [Labrys wisconsinensis]|uniref:TIM-barrel enzyme n=1 Tax=Labrys wisconsinensis TaxID=425677 RepID=A0ABU0J2Y6_9HYPH|nr:hypothetical protein [Labrys wisconsinensis]MDQ0468621.1 putative TIM-barrel enzyme [Labrys wisconsinensis]
MVPSTVPVHQIEALALVNHALAAAEDTLRSGHLDEAERRDIALILLAGIEGGETDPRRLAEVALTLAQTPVRC